MSNAWLPERIVCLTEETTEMLYLLGEQDRIVGISGFTVRPPQARKEKPKVSAFTSAKIDEILELKPDLVLGFSDIQADIAAELIRRGIAVHVFNQRSIDEIYRACVTIGSLVGKQQAATDLMQRLAHKLSIIEQNTRERTRRPKIHFEEWDDPIITGIQWVSEAIRIAGGDDCFPEHSNQHLARDRIVADPEEVIGRQPDIIIGSWCGKKFRPEQVAERPGWQVIPAVRNNRLYEIKSADILQPGPALLLDGIHHLETIIDDWWRNQPESADE